MGWWGGVVGGGGWWGGGEMIVLLGEGDGGLVGGWWWGGEMVVLLGEGDGWWGGEGWWWGEGKEERLSALVCIYILYMCTLHRPLLMTVCGHLHNDVLVSEGDSMLDVCTVYVPALCAVIVISNPHAYMHAHTNTRTFRHVRTCFLTFRLLVR